MKPRSHEYIKSAVNSWQEKYLYWANLYNLGTVDQETGQIIDEWGAEHDPANVLSIMLFCRGNRAKWHERLNNYQEPPEVLPSSYSNPRPLETDINQCQTSITNFNPIFASRKTNNT